MDAAKLAENRQILHTIVIQGLIPMLFFLPVSYSVLMMILGYYQLESHMFVNWTVNLLKCNSAMDGFFTLFTMKAYKKELVAMMEKIGLIKKKTSSTPRLSVLTIPKIPIVPTNVTPASTRGSIIPTVTTGNI